MICEDFHKSIRPFLDDLLKEAEYQEAREHLDVCASCKAYASSIGSLFYQLKEMSEIEIPADLTSTILYRLRHPSRASTPEPPSALPIQEKTSPFSLSSGVGILVICLASFWLIYHQYSKKPAPKSELALSESTQPAAPKAAASAKASRLLRWEVRLPEAHQDDLISMVAALGGVIDYQNKNILVATLPARQYREFIYKIQSIDGVRADFGSDFRIEGEEDEELIQVSITLSGVEERNLE